MTILTTHVGSLPRPKIVSELLFKREKEEEFNLQYFEEVISKSVEEVVKKLENNDQIIHIDLGEIQGFKYHNGIVFSAYSDAVGYVLAKGGRYDGLRKSSDQDRPAVGFDLDLIAVSNL